MSGGVANAVRSEDLLFRGARAQRRDGDMSPRLGLELLRVEPAERERPVLGSGSRYQSSDQ